MKYRLKITVNNETSRVFISKTDAEHIAGRQLDDAKPDDVIEVTSTMAIEVLP